MKKRFILNDIIDTAEVLDYRKLDNGEDVLALVEMEGEALIGIVNKEMDICTLNTVSEEQRKNYTDIDDLYLNLYR